MGFYEFMFLSPSREPLDRTSVGPTLQGVLMAAGLVIVGGSADAASLRLLLQTDGDAGAGADVYITSFTTFDGLINSPPAGGPGAFSGINITPGFSVGGLAFDGAYRLLLESDADAGAGAEVYVASFATFDDLINSPPAGGPGAFSGINITPGFSVRGLAFDGEYRLLLESNADAGAGAEVYVASFATFDDLINSPPAGGPGAFSGINISSGFSVGGLAWEFESGSGDPLPVPLPPTLPLLAGAVAVLRLARRPWARGADTSFTGRALVG